MSKNLKNNVKPKNNSAKSANTQNINLKNQLEEHKAKITAESLKHLISKKKIYNIFDSITDILYGIGKILFLLLLGGGTIGILFFLMWAMWAYFHGEVGLATITMTIMQALSGLVSVVVGIWALVLTINADKKQNTTESILNINKSLSNIDVVGVLDNEDVNPNSL